MDLDRSWMEVSGDALMLVNVRMKVERRRWEGFVMVLGKGGGEGSDGSFLIVVV